MSDTTLVIPEASKLKMVCADFFFDAVTDFSSKKLEIMTWAHKFFDKDEFDATSVTMSHYCLMTTGDNAGKHRYIFKALCDSEGFDEFKLAFPDAQNPQWVEPNVS